MKVLIELPDWLYKAAKVGKFDTLDGVQVMKAVENGIPVSDDNIEYDKETSALNISIPKDSVESFIAKQRPGSSYWVSKDVIGGRVQRILAKKFQ